MNSSKSNSSYNYLFRYIIAGDMGMLNSFFTHIKTSNITYAYKY